MTRSPGSSDLFPNGGSDDSAERRTLLSVLTVLVLSGVWAGVFFLNSPASFDAAGGRPWEAGSLLKAVCDSLALNYEYATPTGVEIKHAIDGVGVCVILVLGVFGWHTATRSFRGVDASPTSSSGRLSSAMAPTLGGQSLLALFVLWSFLTSQWSHAPAYAWGGATVMMLGAFWAFGVGFGLRARHIPAVCVVLVAACVLLAGLNLWYHGVRRPPAPVGYPLGGAPPLSACLTTGLILSVALLWLRPWRSFHFSNETIKLAVVPVLGLAILVIAVALWVNSHWPSWIGILAGLITLAGLALGKRARLPITLIMLIAAATLFYGAVMRSQRIGDRLGNAIRMRAHAWEHAATLIQKRPITGHGPGAFLLYGDGLALSGNAIIDDPAAYGEAPLGRTGSLWCELAFETGLLGVGLFAGVFVLTIVGALRSHDASGMGWRAALIAATVAALAAESLDTNLYKPGLPSVLFVLLGGLWASRPETGMAAWAGQHLSKPLGWAVVVGALGLGVLGLRATVLDWQASRAAHELHARAGALEYDAATTLANLACRYRLRPEGRIDAELARIGLFSQRARQALQRGLRRLSDQQSEDPSATQPAGLALEDVREASAVADNGIRLAADFCGIAQGYPGAGIQLADLWEMALRAGAVLHPTDSPVAYPVEARNALIREHRRRPFDPAIGLRLWRLSGSLPLARQLQLLCGPLRMGRLTPELREALIDVWNRKEFQVELADLGDAVARSVAEDPATWPVWFGPELLGSNAIVAGAGGLYDQAAGLARQALAAGGDYAMRYPRGANLIRQQLAESLFWQRPATPNRAIAVLLPILEQQPSSEEHQEQVRQAEYLLGMYYLAGGDEAHAREMLSKLAQVPGQPVAEQTLGALYADLAAALASRFPPENRPDVWSTAVQRARALAPKSATVALLEARIAFEAGDDEGLVSALKKILKTGGDVRSILREALRQRPDSPPLRAFVRELQSGTDGTPASPDVPGASMPDPADPVRSPQSAPSRRPR